MLQSVYHMIIIRRFCTYVNKIVHYSGVESRTNLLIVGCDKWLLQIIRKPIPQSFGNAFFVKLSGLLVIRIPERIHYI